MGTMFDVLDAGTGEGASTVNSQNNTSDGGVFSNLMNSLSGKGDTIAMIADMVGQKMNPTSSNVFGGIGSQLAQSGMASKKIEADKEQSQDFLTQLIQDLASGSNMNKATIVKDPISGEIKVDTQTKNPRKIESTLPQMETAQNADQTTQQPGTMGDMIEAYKGDK